MATALKRKLPKACELCGYTIPVALEAHRVTPGREGGEYTLDNTIPLCANCHKIVTKATGEVNGQAPRSKDLGKTVSILRKYTEVVARHEQVSRRKPASAAIAA